MRNSSFRQTVLLGADGGRVLGSGGLRDEVEAAVIEEVQRLGPAELDRAIVVRRFAARGAAGFFWAVLGW